MNSVLSFVDFKESRESPVFVLVDVHRGIVAEDDMLTEDFADALENCLAALEHARVTGLPIAFLRQTLPMRSFLETRPYPSWMKGFEPRRTDMVFDRNMPSCYSNSEFAKMIEQNSRSYVLAGLSSEMSCVSTVTDAFHRHHQVTYLADASFCSSKPYFSSAEMRMGVRAVMSLYGAISTTHHWIDVSSRRLGVGT